MTTRETFLSRREFLKWIGVGGVAGTFAGFLLGGLRFLFPNVLYEPPTRFKVGKPGDFPLNQGTFLEKKQIFVFNTAEGFYAVSSICTHLGCSVRKSAKGFECPCHGSKFDENGDVLSGPAPRPLAWYRLNLGRTGDLIVDKQDPVDHKFRLKITA